MIKLYQIHTQQTLYKEDLLYTKEYLLEQVFERKSKNLFYNDIITQIKSMIKQEEQSPQINRFLPNSLIKEEFNQQINSYKKLAKKGFKGDEEYPDLQLSKKRFERFLEEISHIINNPIKEEVLEYCSNYKKSISGSDLNLDTTKILQSMELTIKKMIRTHKPVKKNWPEEDIKIFFWIMSKYSDLRNYNSIEKDMTDEDWKFIASIIPGVTPEACKFKWLSFKKVTLLKYKWSSQESQLLKKIIQEEARRNGVQYHRISGKIWKQISQKLYKMNPDSQKVYRNPKFCKEHWSCHLNDEIKRTQWQPIEDYKLLKLIKQSNGCRKWVVLARYFKNRTQNGIKNRYHLIIQKSLKKNPRNSSKSEMELISQNLQSLLKKYPELNMRSQSQKQEEEEYNQLVKVEDEGCDYVVNRFESEELSDNRNFKQLKYEKMDYSSLMEMNLQFLKNIQPGWIGVDGNFIGIENSRQFLEEVKKEPEEISYKSMFGTSFIH